jgi:hypothetical protein
MSDHKDYWTDEYVEGLHSQIKELQAEVEKARNAALSEAIEKINKEYGSVSEMHLDDYIEILEGLKIKP